MDIEILDKNGVVIVQLSVPGWLIAVVVLAAVVSCAILSYPGGMQ